MPDILTVSMSELLGAYQLGVVTQDEVRYAMGFKPLETTEEGK